MIALSAALLLQAAADPHAASMPRLEPCGIEGAGAPSGSLGELPEEVRAELRRFFTDGLADAGGAFNASDVVNSEKRVPQRRFLRAYRRGDRWIVWYEHGGLGYHLHAVGMAPRQGGGIGITPFSRYGGSDGRQLCAGSKAFFDGAETSEDL